MGSTVIHTKKRSRRKDKKATVENTSTLSGRGSCTLATHPSVSGLRIPKLNISALREGRVTRKLKWLYMSSIFTGWLWLSSDAKLLKRIRERHRLVPLC